MEFVMNIILSSVRMATPLIFLALAELYSQRAGLVHIGLEGLASIGSLVGFLVSLITGSPMLGVLAGAAVGILVNMIFAYATVTLCAEQIVYGMAINIFAPALAAFIYRVYFGAGSELVQVGLMNTLSSSLGITSDNFLVRLLLDQTPMVYLAYALVIFTVIYFNRTKSGLNYKAVGEYPKAAATLGINVIGVKYAACVICGALAGLMTKSGTVAFIGAMELDTTLGKYNGFKEAAAYVGQQEGKTVSTLDVVYSGDFSAADKGIEFAKAMIDQGADVFFGDASAVDSGARQAIDEANAASGSVSIYDIAQPSDLLGQNECIIGSQVTDNASLVGLCMEAVEDGSFGGEVIYGTLQNGALSAGALSDLVPADVQEKYQGYLDQMVDGSFMQ